MAALSVITEKGFVMNNDMYKLLSALCVLFFVSFLELGCGHGSNGGVNRQSESYVWEKGEDLKICDFVDSVEYIPLEETPQSYLRQIDKLVVEGSRLLVYDHIGRNQVVAFDKNGNYLYCVGRKGRGPGEYVRMCNFTVDSNYIYIINDIAPSVMFFSVLDGSFVKEKKLDFSPYDLVAFRNGDFAFSMPMCDECDISGGKIIITDDDMKVRKRVLPVTASDNVRLNKVSHFIHTDKHYIYSTFYSDTLVIFDKETPNEYRLVAVDFNEFKIPESYRKKESLENKSWLYLNENVVLTSDFIFGKFGTDYYIFNLNNGKAYTSEPGGNYRYSRVQYATDEYIYSSFFNRYAVYKSYVERGMNRLPDDVEKLMSEGICVIVKYKMK